MANGYLLQVVRYAQIQKEMTPNNSNIAKYLKIAYWNIRTIIDRGRPEHWSSLIAHELSRPQIDIASLSEIQLP